jgi:DNA-binding CsgD family transcriptional regulator
VSTDGGETRTVLPAADADIAPVVPCLKVVRGPEPGSTFSLPEGTHLLGRHPDCALCFPDDGLSRQHAKLVVRAGGEVQIIDLGSHNGTRVDGQRVEAAVLHEGSSVTVGRLELRFGFTRPATSATGTGTGLSKRELEVARLVAQGLSNAEIGKRLHISPKTVTAHLTHIYDRLGFRTRAALVRWLSDQALL